MNIGFIIKYLIKRTPNLIMFEFLKRNSKIPNNGIKKKPSIIKQQPTIFQAYPVSKPITLIEVQDMFVTCKNMKTQDKIEYAYSIGIDYNRASEYYQIVSYCERCWNKKSK